MPEFIYVLRPTRFEMLTDGPTGEEQQILGDHLQYLTRLNESGVVVLAGRTQTQDEKTFGIVIYKAENEAAASKIMHEDPAVSQHVMTADLFPYRIAVH